MTTSYVKAEKLNFRDERYSNRHRNWGRKLYLFDADGIEYNSYGEPVCFIELKHGAVAFKDGVDLTSWQVKCHRTTSDRLGVPFFVIVYYPTGFDQVTEQTDMFGPHWAFHVIPANATARKLLPTPQLMSEATYVELLYWLRKDKVPTDLVLDTVKPDVPLPKIIF